jgi:hypothetical protein
VDFGCQEPKLNCVNNFSEAKQNEFFVVGCAEMDLKKNYIVFKKYIFLVSFFCLMCFQQKKIFFLYFSLAMFFIT